MYRDSCLVLILHDSNEHFRLSAIYKGDKNENLVKNKQIP